MLRNRVSLDTYVSRRRTEWSSPSTACRPSSAFSPARSRPRLSEGYTSGAGGPGRHSRVATAARIVPGTGEGVAILAERAFVVRREFRSPIQMVLSLIS